MGIEKKNHFIALSYAPTTSESLIPFQTFYCIGKKKQKKKIQKNFSAGNKETM